MVGKTVSGKWHSGRVIAALWFYSNPIFVTAW